MNKEESVVLPRPITQGMKQQDYVPSLAIKPL